MPNNNDAINISRELKEKLLNQKSKVIWFTGLPCSGKTTLALHLENFLFKKKITSVVLDGDIIRKCLNKDLGFSTSGRSENVRRISEVSKLLVNNGVVVIVCLVSPLTELRTIAKDIIGEEDFIEIYVNAPLCVCEKRDVKGMYKKARKGEIKDFTGINSVYEKPENPYLEILTAEDSIEESLEIVIHKLYPLLKM